VIVPIYVIHELCHIFSKLISCYFSLSRHCCPLITSSSAIPMVNTPPRARAPSFDSSPLPPSYPPGTCWAHLLFTHARAGSESRASSIPFLMKWCSASSIWRARGRSTTNTWGCRDFSAAFRCVLNLYICSQSLASCVFDSKCSLSSSSSSSTSAMSVSPAVLAVPSPWLGGWERPPGCIGLDMPCRTRKHLFH